MKHRLLILLTIFLCCQCVLFSQTSVENEPGKIDHEVNLYEYIPFDGRGKLAKLNGESSLVLTENLPILDGATSFFPVYASFAEAVYPSTSFSSLYRGIIRCSQTSRAFENLINGEVDIIFCFEPSLEQLEQASEKGKTFNMIPIGKDAFVFFVNQKNPVNTISTKQIQDIYSGKIKNWNEAGGEDREIIPYQRPKNSGSQTILESIMKDIPIMEPLKENVFYGMGEIIQQVSVYRNHADAIGYSFLFYATEMAANNEIKFLSIDGEKPSKETIQSDKYPFTVTFYAITAGNETENTKKFIEWILSSEGQYLIEKTGYVPLK